MAKAPRFRRPVLQSDAERDAREHNELVKLYIHEIGKKLDGLKSYGAKMVVLESLTVGLIASVIYREGKDPNATLDAFIAGIKLRLNDLLSE